MKKIKSLFSVLLILILLSGCGGNVRSDVAESQTTAVSSTSSALQNVASSYPIETQTTTERSSTQTSAFTSEFSTAPATTSEAATAASVGSSAAQTETTQTSTSTAATATTAKATKTKSEKADPDATLPAPVIQADGKYENAYADDAFISYIAGAYGTSLTDKINEAVSNGEYSNGLWYSLTGKSIYVLYDEYEGRNSELKYSVRDAANESVITFGFAGDIQFDYGMAFMRRYKYKGTITSILSEDLLEIMKSRDVMAANNEFPVSKRGNPVPKYINFRSDPENLEMYHEMGVDFVSLANNHVYDYGPEAFMDTIQAMKDYKMDFAGAGKDLAEASEPFFYVIGGRKIAILCGSRAEKTYVTPIATEDSLGVFGMYDSENMKKAVAKAKAESDFVIIFTHWGKENSPEIEKKIRAQGHEYIDCGADLIIGVHAHQLQGIEFYRGKMIAYNLGNFLFFGTDLKTGLITVDIDPETLSYSSYFVPCIYNVNNARLCKGKDRTEVLDYMRSIAPAVNIDDDGKITIKTK